MVHTAMNAQGLSLGYMLSQAPGESLASVPILWQLFRRVMEEASTIDEALAILEAGPRRGAANLLLADGLAPAAYRRFVGFSLEDELDDTQAQTAVPSLPADPIVGSRAWAEVEAFQAGYSAYLQGDDATAAERLAEAVPLNPHCARYGYYLGRALTNLGRDDEAIAVFEAALAGDPQSSYCAYIYYRLGRIYETLGDREKMHAAFEQVLVLDIGDEEIEGYARQALGR